MSFGTRKPLLSRTPCSKGRWPVSMFTCEGSVTTLCAWAASKRTPSRASRSIHGVRARALPYAPMASARSVSIETSSTDNPGSRGSEETSALHAIQPRTAAAARAAATAPTRHVGPLTGACVAGAGAPGVGDGDGVGMGRRFLASSGSGNIHSKCADVRDRAAALARGLDLYWGRPGGPRCVALPCPPPRCPPSELC